MEPGENEQFGSQGGTGPAPSRGVNLSCLGRRTAGPGRWTEQGGIEIRVEHHNVLGSGEREYSAHTMAGSDDPDPATHRLRMTVSADNGTNARHVAEPCTGHVHDQPAGCLVEQCQQRVANRRRIDEIDLSGQGSSRRTVQVLDRHQETSPATGHAFLSQDL
jgi:hypothetical protein